MRFAITVFHLNISSRIFEKVTGKWTFSSNSFFCRQISKVATKTKSATIGVFLFSSFLPHLSLFLLSFSFVSVILGLIAPRKLGSISAVSRVRSFGGWVRAHFPEQRLVIEPTTKHVFWRLFWHLFTQITANFVRLVFKKSARCITRSVIINMMQRREKP